MKNAVGPVLRMSDEVELVIRAIEDDNPDTEIQVIDRGSYVRIHGENRLRVTQESLRRHLGPSFEISSLELMLSAFAGRITTTSDEISWEFKRTKPASASQAGANS